MKPSLNPIGKAILGTVAGVIVGGIMVGFSEKIGHSFYPPPEGLDFNDPVVLKELIATLPVGAFLFVLLAYGLGAIAGSITGGLIGGRNAAVIAGAILCLFGFMTLLMIPHPIWFGPSVLVVNGLGTILGLQVNKAIRGNKGCC